MEGCSTGCSKPQGRVGVIANTFSIADPNDAGMLDVVGFSTDVPTVLADFIRG